MYLIELVNRKRGRANHYLCRSHQTTIEEKNAGRPHRGGQSILKFAPWLRVYWAIIDACADAEDKMIERFRKLVGRLPYGNRMRSARAFRSA